MSGQAPTFSYAQAAKGLASNQNSAPSSRIASGAITPAKDAVTSPVISAMNGSTMAENLDVFKGKDTVESLDKSTLRKSIPPPNGTASPPSPPYVDSSISTLNREDDLSSIPNASSDSTWENVSQTSVAQDSKPSDDKPGKDKMENSWVQIQKPAVEVEAPQPSVNVWQQRMEQATKKVPAPANSDNSSDTMVADNGLNIQGLKKDPSRERVQPQRQQADETKSKKGKKAEEKPQVAPPSLQDEASWPTPETLLDPERKQSLDKTPVLDKDKKGKKSWVALDMPPPSVVFQTAIPNTHPRRGGRVGRGGREGNRGSPPGRERQSGNPRPEKDSRQSTSPKGKRAVSDEMPSRRDSRLIRDTTQHVNGEQKPAGTQDDKQPFNTFPRNSSRGHRRQELPQEAEKKKDAKQEVLNTETANSDSGSTPRPTPMVVSDEPKQGSATEPLVSAKFPRNGTQLPFQPANRRGSVRGRGGNHGFHSPGHQASAFQNFNMNRSPPIAHDAFYGQHGGRGGFRGNRNSSVPADWSGRFASPGPYHQGMLPPLNTFVNQSDMMYDQPQPQPMSAVPYTYHMAQYNLVGSVSLQMEYYFSFENLIKDNYLRKQMDSQGFVLLSTIADFKRMKSLTQDLDLLKFVCQTSHLLEWRLGIDGKDRVRVREGWQKWVMEKPLRDPIAQHDGVEAQQTTPSEFNVMPLRQNSMPGPYPNYPASAFPAINGHSHQEFFPSPPQDSSNFARFQASPPVMGPPFSPPGPMMDSMMRPPAQYPKEEEVHNLTDKMVVMNKSLQNTPVNGVNPSAPNGTGPHENRA